MEQCRLDPSLCLALNKTLSTPLRTPERSSRSQDSKQTGAPAGAKHVVPRWSRALQHLSTRLLRLSSDLSGDLSRLFSSAIEISGAVLGKGLLVSFVLACPQARPSSLALRATRKVWYVKLIWTIALPIKRRRLITCRTNISIRPEQHSGQHSERVQVNIRPQGKCQKGGVLLGLAT